MSTKQQATIAVIGGSGLYEMDGMTGATSVDVDTPFGKPSDSIIVGELDGVKVAFLPRHGKGHRFNPSHIPARANIYALKSIGVERIISVSAVGSLKEEFAPLDLVIPSQLIDRTRLRESTFFDTDVVVHVAMADPFCAHTSHQPSSPPCRPGTGYQRTFRRHHGRDGRAGVLHQGRVFHVPLLGS